MSHPSVRRIAAALVLALASGGVATAQPSPVGTPLQTSAMMIPGDLAVIGADCDQDDEDGLFAAGGSTLIVATAPGGPLFGSLFVPFDSLNACPGFSARGVPPGTYWLLFVVGNTTAASAPLAYWAQLVVAPACIGPPGAPALSTNVTGSQLTLNTIGTGCNWDRLEFRVGSSPGASDLGTFSANSPQLVYSGVPTGQYYVRARAFNPYGVSGWSLEQPVRVPACGMGDLLPQGPLTPAVTVGAGNVVTVSWSHTTLAWLTFHQLAVKKPNGDLVDSFVLPAGATSISGPVPSGSYRIGLLSGGPCGRSSPVTGDLIFTVP